MVSDSRVISLLNIKTSTVTENQNVEVITMMLKILFEDMVMNSQGCLNNI